MPHHSKEKWNALASSFSEISPLNSPDFIEVMEKVYHCKHLHITTNIHQPLAIPAYRVATPFFGKKITTSPFNYYPPLIGHGDDVSALKEMISIAKEASTKWYVEYKSFTAISAETCAALNVNYHASSIVSHLELLGSYDAQKSGYRSSLRQNLRTTARHAQSENITIDWATNENELRQWYKLLVQLYRDKHHMICQPWELYTMLQKKGLGRLLAAKKGAEVIGGIFIIFSQQEWLYSWSAYKPDWAKIGLNTLLVDHAIAQAINAGAKRFDFGSSSPTDRDLIYFKSRWGCVERPIYYYYWNHKPHPLNLDSSFPLMRRIFAKLPLGILCRIPSILVPLLA